MGFMFAYIFTRLVATAIVVAVVQRTRSWFRLRHFPGPVFASFLEWWHLKHVLGGRMHLDAQILDFILLFFLAGHELTFDWA